MKDRFHLFTYGTLRSGGASGVMDGCRHVAFGTVPGSLYDVDGRYPALLRGEEGAVEGEVWSCPAGHLPALDRHEGVEDGLFRRVGVRVGEHACWMYVAGPAVARWLTPERRIPSGSWSRAGTEAGSA